MLRTLAVLTMGLAVAAAPLSAADETEGARAVEEWEIDVDPTIENGCYAVAKWDGGTVLRIGLNPEERNFYLLIGNDAWSSVRPDTVRDLKLQFDLEPPWEISAHTLQFAPGATVYLHAESEQGAFVEEFMRARHMRITFGGNEMDVLELTGSSRAIRTVAECQKRIEAESGATEAEAPDTSAEAEVGEEAG